METKKILQGKELVEFDKISKRLWELSREKTDLYDRLKEMGLEFDIMGKPQNFEIQRGDE